MEGGGGPPGPVIKALQIVIPSEKAWLREREMHPSPGGGRKKSLGVRAVWEGAGGGV